MRDAQNIREVKALGIDMMGFIFYPKSPRCVISESFQEIIESSHPCRRVGVFVNEDMATILSVASSFQLHTIQLHGTESPNFCKELKDIGGYEIIKTFSIGSKKDVEKINPRYGEVCDYFLFDTKCEGFGGSGKRFDWDILHTYKGDTPFLLSGGLNKDSIMDLKKFQHPSMAGVDLNSGFEIAPAIKDINRLKVFIVEIKEK